VSALLFEIPGFLIQSVSFEEGVSAGVSFLEKDPNLQITRGDEISNFLIICWHAPNQCLCIILEVNGHKEVLSDKRIERLKTILEKVELLPSHAQPLFSTEEVALH
jgi:hypothetical protein